MSRYRRNSCNNSCNDTCGCDHYHDASCIYYKGTSYSCIPVTKGQDLDTVIDAMADYICNELSPPSGHVYIVDSCDDNIGITTTTVGSVTTYEVCLDADLVTQIEDNTSNIATALSCIADGVYDLVSTDGTVSISVDSTVDCGRILDLSVAPSGVPIYDGIVYSDITPATLPTGSGTTVTVKTFTRNYTASNAIDDSDEIRLRITGRIKGNGDADQMKVRIKNSGGSIVGEYSFSRPSTASDIISSYVIDGSIIVDKTNSKGIVTLKMESNSQNNGIVGGVSRPNELMVADEITTIDWTQNVTIEIAQVNNSLQTFTDNNVTSIVVDVRKTI